MITLAAMMNNSRGGSMLALNANTKNRMPIIEITGIISDKILRIDNVYF